VGAQGAGLHVAEGCLMGHGALDQATGR